MDLDWKTIDRWLMGEAWTGAQIGTHLNELCKQIGPRWASSSGEWKAVSYLCAQLRDQGLDQASLEEFELHTWEGESASARLVETDREIDLLPFNRCPPFAAQGPIVDVGYGTPRELERQRHRLEGGIAVMYMAFEPFTQPIPHALRLQSLAAFGAAAAVVIDPKNGRRMEYHSASDWRDPELSEHPLPTVTTSREHGSLLHQLAREGRNLHIEVKSRFYSAPAHNVNAQLDGVHWPQEHLLLGAHHDTVYGAPGGNDNASGTIAVIETARVLAQLRAEMGIAPGRTIRFATYSAEEQKLQGSTAYVERHYGPESPPRLAINLDELSTGHIKGIVLGFPHLRDLLQHQLDSMGDGLKCHVMAQLDPSSDHFPFLRAGIDAAHLWRWRFVGRHADSDYHHEPGDTADKLNLRDLKEYLGQLARLLLRLSHVPPGEWPENAVTVAQVQERLEAERGTVVRVF